MSRKKLIRSSLLPYHVTARSNNRERFPLELPKMWTILGSECLSASLKFGAQFQSVVLMPNHFHMLVSTPESDLGSIMNEFMSNLTKITNQMAGRSGHLFGGPYHRSIIENSRYYGHAFKYVYRNPVKAQICERVEDYPYSTLYGLTGFARLDFPVSPGRPEITISIPGSEPYEFLPWLNTVFPGNTESLIQAGLKKKTFGKIICRESRQEYEELRHLI
jgi:putative transposase